MKAKQSQAAALFSAPLSKAVRTFAALSDKLPAGEQKLGPWIDKHNWLDIENQRLTLQSASVVVERLSTKHAQNSKNLASEDERLTCEGSNVFPRGPLRTRDPR